MKKPTYNELVYAVAVMVGQYCEGGEKNKDFYYHSCMHAGEHAFDVLERLGIMSDKGIMVYNDIEKNIAKIIQEIK